MIRPADVDPPGRWRQLALLVVTLLLAMAPWFSASSVAPLLSEAWQTSGLELPLLTVAVQLGFAAGALGLAILGVPDVVPGPRLFAGGALLAGVANLGFAVVPGDWIGALPFRVLTGAALAAVYPVAMKLAAGWFARGRGLAIGWLIGAVTAGSALPFLFRAIGAYVGVDWRPVVVAASIASLVAAALALVALRPGPLETPAPRFSPAIARAAFARPSVRLANLGYLGHMWELYAMWTWIPAFLLAAFAVGGLEDPALGSLAAFAVIASGAVGCVVAGAVADRAGRTATTIGALAVSGGAALVSATLFGAPAWLVLLVAVVWGVSVVADSAQFSSAVSELAPAGTAGSALSIQTASGFLLTGVTILGIGVIAPADADGWRLAWALLAVGPVVGIVAMLRLRGRPDAIRMANGHR